MIRRLLIFAALNLAFDEGALAQDDVKSVGSFADLRAEVLDTIGGASRRIWLVTDYLTDGEIVSALYLAQYRKLDVQVLLGRGKANFYMSRLNYLKNQNIPVFLRPDSFKPGHASMLLADDRLLMIDGELDFLAKVRQYRLQFGAIGQREAFQTGFASAISMRVPAVPHQIPLVGKAQGRGRVYTPPTGGHVSSRPGSSPGATPPPPGQSYSPSPRVDASGAYVYDRAQQPRPDGVPAKLPKAVKWGEAAPKPASIPKAPAPASVPGPAEEEAPAPPALPHDGG